MSNAASLIASCERQMQAWILEPARSLLGARAGEWDGSADDAMRLLARVQLAVYRAVGRSVAIYRAWDRYAA